MTDKPEFGAPRWRLPPVTTPALLKKVIVDAVTPLMPKAHVRTLLDVGDQKLHVQITQKAATLTYDEFVAAILRKLADAYGIPYDELTKGWPREEINGVDSNISDLEQKTPSEEISPDAEHSDP